MLKVNLPETKINPDDTKGLCKCRPVCKNRRHEWKGKILKSPGEVLLERKPVADCIRRWPKKVYPNSPCPLFAKTKGVVIEERNKNHLPPQQVVRICPAPIDTVVPTPYLRAAAIAKQNGALDMVQACCPFCMCGKCCDCGDRIYPINDPDRDNFRRKNMREFDTRVKHSYKEFRTLYN